MYVYQEGEERQDGLTDPNQGAADYIICNSIDAYSYEVVLIDQWILKNLFVHGFDLIEEYNKDGFNFFVFEDIGISLKVTLKYGVGEWKPIVDTELM